MSDERELLDEGVLRRALRLDAEEMPARLDAALIAAAAAEHAPGRGPIVATAAIAFVAGWVWSEVLRVLAGALFAAGAIDVVAAVVSVVTSVAIGVAPLAEAATQPAVPLAVMAAAAIAVLHERGRTHATAKV